MEIIKPHWSSTTFLMYAGAITALIATFFFVDEVTSGDGALFGWAALALLVAAGLTLLFERQGMRLAAGLLAFVAVVLWALAFSRLEEWVGWEPLNNGFNFSKLLLLLVVLAAAVAALRRFRFPLLVAIVVGVSWELGAQFLESSGSGWVAAYSILFGLVLLPIALAMDTSSRPYGFWLHVAVGLAIGLGLLHFWGSSHLDHALLVVLSLVYIVSGWRWQRSSYAVFGALGLLLAATHFIDEWAGELMIPFFSFGESESGSTWERPLAYVGFGLLLLLIGVLLERRRRVSVPE